MRSAYRISPRLVAALFVAGAILIGWVARSTRAQDGAKASPPALPSEATKPDPGTSVPDPGPPSEEAAPAIQDSAFPTPTAPKPGPHHLADHSVPLNPGPPDPAGPANDDPEKNARAFLEQNRRVAQGELRNLKDEAERLRTRLGKVEAGIRRWEALVAALDHSEKPATPGPAMPPGADHPTELSPVDAPKRAMAVRESTPSAPADATPSVLKVGPNEPGAARKPADPPPIPSSDNSPTRPKGPDVDIDPTPPPGPALEPR